jgi:hypothetical protein
MMKNPIICTQMIPRGQKYLTQNVLYLHYLYETKTNKSPTHRNDGTSVLCKSSLPDSHKSSNVRFKTHAFFLRHGSNFACGGAKFWLAIVLPVRGGDNALPPLLHCRLNFDAQMLCRFVVGFDSERRFYVVECFRVVAQR